MKNNELKDENMEVVSGGDVTSENIVGYKERFVDLHEVPDIQSWNTSILEDDLNKVSGGEAEHRWYCEENKDNKYDAGSIGSDK